VGRRWPVREERGPRVAKQCAEYLREAARESYGNERFQPLWGFVSDMNEFRLYWRNTIPSQYQRFVLERKSLFDEGVSLLDDNEEARFHRYVFKRLFHADTLLTRADGQNPLLRLLKEQGQSEKNIENVFYGEYRA
jgi:hypothetical protein